MPSKLVQPFTCYVYMTSVRPPGAGAPAATPAKAGRMPSWLVGCPPSATPEMPRRGDLGSYYPCEIFMRHDSDMMRSKGSMNIPCHLMDQATEWNRQGIIDMNSVDRCKNCLCNVSECSFKVTVFAWDDISHQPTPCVRVKRVVQICMPTIGGMWSTAASPPVTAYQKHLCTHKEDPVVGACFILN